jgi:hypothetical protein
MVCIFTVCTAWCVYLQCVLHGVYIYSVYCIVCIFAVCTAWCVYLQCVLHGVYIYSVYCMVCIFTVCTAWCVYLQCVLHCVVTIPDVKFEQACILYNIGELHSILGSIETRQSADVSTGMCV